MVRTTDGEYVMVVRSYDEAVMLQTIKRLQGLRQKDLKRLFKNLEEDYYECS